MKAGRAVVLLLAGAVLAGCSSAPGANPNLLAPKLVVDLTWAGDAQVFIHSAFGERIYDDIELKVDNVTRATTNATHSLETRLVERAFFLEAFVAAGKTRFAYAGAFEFTGEAGERRLRVVDFDGANFGEDRPCQLPCEKVLRQETEEAPP